LEDKGRRGNICQWKRIGVFSSGHVPVKVKRPSVKPLNIYVQDRRKGKKKKSFASDIAFLQTDQNRRCF